MNVFAIQKKGLRDNVVVCKNCKKDDIESSSHKICMRIYKSTMQHIHSSWSKKHDKGYDKLVREALHNKAELTKREYSLSQTALNLVHFNCGVLYNKTSDNKVQITHLLNYIPVSISPKLDQSDEIIYPIIMYFALWIVKDFWMITTISIKKLCVRSVVDMEMQKCTHSVVCVKNVVIMIKNL